MDSLSELVSASQEADLRKAEEEYKANRAAQMALKAASTAKGGLTMSELLKKMYGDESVASEAPARSMPQLSKEKKDEQRKDPFPPPPTTR